MASNPRFNPNDALELAAARMTRFLAHPPRSRKTRAYLETLPKRSKVVVTPSDYQLRVEHEPSWRETMLREIRDARRYAEWEARGKPPSPSVPPKKRKDRLRPRITGRDPLRMRLYEAQRGICGICSEAIYDVSRGTIDHVLPRALGGKNARNVLLAHFSCNNAKADRPPTRAELEMLALVNARLALDCDSDGTATAAVCEDMPAPKGCQARAESIAQDTFISPPKESR